MKILPKSQIIQNNINKKTNTYKEKLKIKNPNLEVIDSYVKSDVEILHKYINCGHEVMIKPSFALSGKSSCKICRYKQLSKNKQWTHEYYIQKLHEISPNIEVREKYQGTTTKILHYCMIHDVEWMAYPSNMLKGVGCVKCGNEKIGNKLRRSNDEYIQLLYLENPNIIVCETYKGADIPINHKCLVCDCIWKVAPASILNQHTGCPKCANNQRRLNRVYSKEQYIDIIKSINPNVILISDYYNSMTPCYFQCKICGHQWQTYSGNIIKGHGCPKCSAKATSQRMTKTHDQFIEDFNRKNEHSNFIKILSQYVHSHELIKCQCLICGQQWEVQATTLLSGGSCPGCFSSAGERRIISFLKNKNIEFVKPKKFDDLIGYYGKQLSYDFYLPHYNKLIEYQGEQHEKPIETFGGYSQFKKQQEYDNIKREYAKTHNIELIEIWYYDFNNIEKILNNKLKLESVETAGIA